MGAIPQFPDGYSPVGPQYPLGEGETGFWIGWGREWSMGIRGIAISSHVPDLPEWNPFLFVTPDEALTMFYFLRFASERLLKLVAGEPRGDDREPREGEKQESPSLSALFALPAERRNDEQASTTQEAQARSVEAFELFNEAYAIYRDKVQLLGPFWLRFEETQAVLRREASLSEGQKQKLSDLMHDYHTVLAVAMNALCLIFGGFSLERE